MLQILANVLKIGGQMALGYFANDVATTAGKLTGVKTDPTTGKYPWWFIVGVVGLIGAALYYVVDKFILKGKKR